MSTPIVGDGLLIYISGILTKILVFLVASRIAKFALKVALVVAAAFAFYEFFWIVEAKVNAAMQLAYAKATAAGGSLGTGMQFAGCMLPTSIGEAATMMLNIYVFAATVKLTRIFMLAKVT